MTKTLENESKKRVRNIIRIDESKCNGCGQCITGCAEGALALLNGKAKLVKESYCDGLGACIGECPTGALTIEQREADDFDEGAVKEYLEQQEQFEGPPQASPLPLRSGCPGSQQRQFEREQSVGHGDGDMPSALSQWPVQLRLVNPTAPYFRGAHLVVAADCTAFAYGAFHRDMMAGKKLVIACPKLDDSTGYIEKLTELFATADLKAVTTVRMEVPCCGGLLQMVTQARDEAGVETAIEDIVVGIEGNVLSKREL